jgi:ATP-dependent Lhr-like helicase
VVKAGVPLAWLGRSERSLLTFASDDDPSEAIAMALAQLVLSGRRRALLVAQIDGEPAERSAFGPALVRRGFTATSRGLLLRRRGAAPRPDDEELDELDA